MSVGPSKQGMNVWDRMAVCILYDTPLLPGSKANANFEVRSEDCVIRYS